MPTDLRVVARELAAWELSSSLRCYICREEATHACWLVDLAFRISEHRTRALSTST